MSRPRTLPYDRPNGFCVLPERDERLSRTADRVLRQCGVDVRMGTSVKEATPGGVLLMDAVLPCQAVQLGLVRSWSVPLETASPERGEGGGGGDEPARNPDPAQSPAPDDTPGPARDTTPAPVTRPDRPATPAEEDS